MQILEFNPIELKEAIDEGRIISDAGFQGVVFLHGNRLLKLHKELFHYLKINSKDFANSTFEEIYRWNKDPFVEIEQIEYLQQRQKDIKLTDFDQGVVKVNEQVCGTILTPHLDYQDLTKIEIFNSKTLLKILINILNAIKELEQNQISHLDLAKGEKNQEPTLNILYKGTDIKLCDLSGNFITYGSEFNSEGMYQEYAQVIKILLKKLIILYPDLKEIKLDKLINYEEANQTIYEVEKVLKK